MPGNSIVESVNGLRASVAGRCLRPQCPPASYQAYNCTMLAIRHHACDLRPFGMSTGLHGRRLALTAARGRPPVISVEYTLSGDTARLVVPQATTAGFADRLWEHTCCELFVAVDPGAGYLEFNFAPSGAWAAYAFDGYRHGMRALPDARAPAITCTRDSGGLRLSIALDLEGLPVDAAATMWRVAASAVLEFDDGSREYWALAHPAERPDFHHPGSFTLALDRPPVTAFK